jgi:hypothetical protein
MEKVKIKKCINTNRITSKGDPVIEIELDDGRIGSAFDTLFLGLPLNQELEIEVKSAPDYKEEKRYYFLMPKKEGGKKFPAKDWQFEKRKLSLQFAIDSVLKIEDKVTTGNILSLSDTYFEYLNKK